MNTYFIADAHLGSRLTKNPREQELKLVHFLDSIKKDAQAIYFMGDMFDFWFEYKWVVPKGYVRFLGKIAELADSGIELHFFTGNHDIWTFGYLEKEIGMTIHQKPTTLTINNKTCFLAHGDGLHSHDKKFMFVRKIFHNAICQKLFGCLPPRIGLRFGYAWSENNRRKELKYENNYNGEDNEELVCFAKKHEETQHADFYIFGHRHIMLDLLLSTHSRVIILGDFIRHFSYAVMSEKGELRLETL